MLQTGFLGDVGDVVVLRTIESKFAAYKFKTYLTAAATSKRPTKRATVKSRTQQMCVRMFLCMHFATSVHRQSCRHKQLACDDDVVGQIKTIPPPFNRIAYASSRDVRVSFMVVEHRQSRTVHTARSVVVAVVVIIVPMKLLRSAFKQIGPTARCSDDFGRRALTTTHTVVNNFVNVSTTRAVECVCVTNLNW